MRLGAWRRLRWAPSGRLASACRCSRCAVRAETPRRISRRALPPGRLRAAGGDPVRPRPASSANLLALQPLFCCPFGTAGVPLVPYSGSHVAAGAPLLPLWLWLWLWLWWAGDWGGRVRARACVCVCVVCVGCVCRLGCALAVEIRCVYVQPPPRLPVAVPQRLHPAGHCVRPAARRGAVVPRLVVLLQLAVVVVLLVGALARAPPGDGAAGRRCPGAVWLSQAVCP